MESDSKDNKTSTLGGRWAKLLPPFLEKLIYAAIVTGVGAILTHCYKTEEASLQRRLKMADTIVQTQSTLSALVANCVEIDYALDNSKNLSASSLVKENPDKMSKLLIESLNGAKANLAQLRYAFIFESALSSVNVDDQVDEVLSQITVLDEHVRVGISDFSNNRFPENEDRTTYRDKFSTQWVKTLRCAASALDELSK